MSPGGRGLGVRRRFPETPLAPCDGDFLASAQTVSQAVNRITGEDSTQGHIFSCVRVAAAGPQRVNKQAVKRVHDESRAARHADRAGEAQAEEPDSPRIQSDYSTAIRPPMNPQQMI